MKKILIYIAAAALVAMSAVSCTPTEKEFNEAFLYGEWMFTMGSEEVHLTFNSNGTGYQTTDTQPEHQNFDWELVGERLGFVHYGEFDQAVPEDCTVLTLTETTLVYEEENGTRRNCIKQ